MSIILVADDNAIIRKTIRNVLEDAGHSILVASNGQEALQVLRETPVDIILLDVIMPGKGGLETMLEMNGSEINTRVIVMTGKIDTEGKAFQTLCGRFHAEKILTKPFTNRVLLQTIAEITQPSTKA